MKRSRIGILVILTITTLLAGCTSSTPPRTIVQTGGSTSVEKIVNALIYQFQAENSDIMVNYEANGSSDGIKNTRTGIYEIGHSSRALKTDGSEDGLNVISYAIDGIAIIVNKANNVENLTKEQLKDIYTGKIKNWQEVGGKNVPITVVTRESGSGTRVAFIESIGLSQVDLLVPTATICNNNGAVQTTVRQNPNAIGYLSFSDVNQEKVKISRYENTTISLESLQDGTYELKREFYLLTKEGDKLTPAAQAFLDFVRSEAGRTIILENKLIPAK